MKLRSFYFLISSFIVISLVCSVFFDEAQLIESDFEQEISKMDSKHEPYDEFYVMRNYPDVFDHMAYKNEIEKVAKSIRLKDSRSTASWLVEGPGNIGGRINEVITHPTNSDIIFVGNASGGIFKTVNGGASWYPVFDEHPYLAIGEIIFDPVDSDILYAGTGDPNISGYPFVGNGVYKSTDGGETWTHLGLPDKGIVSKICVNPLNTSIIYVATMGLPFYPDNNRGLYKSVDGGTTWIEVLHLSDQAGIIDLIMDPANPDVLYAAGWDRVRNNFESIAEGPNSKIFKTTNGGDSWTVLTGGLPLMDMSRIGLTMSGTNPDVLYAVYVDPMGYQVSSVYKTSDGGVNWSDLGSLGIESALGGFGWYFAQIRVNPTDDNELFMLGVDLYKSTDGGASWFMSGPEWSTYEFHADKHDLFFIDATTLLCATDGGLYRSDDGGANWIDIENIPNNQFYRIAVNETDPGFYGGGVQDNGTVYGNASDIDNWMRLFGGDGFQCIFHPTNPDIFYCEYQNGGLYAFDGMDWIEFTVGIEAEDRRSWDMPIIMSQHDPELLYTGTYRMYKHEFAPYGMWESISGDLTSGVDEKYFVITAIGESPVSPDHLYAGTSDGYVHVSTDGGTTWNDVTGTLPERYVTAVVGSPIDENALYVGHSGYKLGENIPHIHKSTDNGNTWIDISGDLPQLAVNDILVFNEYDDQAIFVATDGGVYATENGGVNWYRVGDNMPIMPVYDIDYEQANRKLLAGTFARSMMSIEVDSVLITEVKETAQEEIEVKVYPTLITDHINIELAEPGMTDIHIYSSTGQLVVNGMVKTKGRIELGNLASGAYTVVISDGQTKTSKKIIKQ